MSGDVRWFSPPRLLGPTLQVRGIGVGEEMQPCLIDRPAGTGDWLFMGFSTPSWIGSDAGDRLYEAHRFIVWPAGARQYYGHPQRQYAHSWIHCDGELVPRICRQAGVPEGRVIELHDWVGMESILRQLSDELQREDGHDEEIAAHFFRILIRTIVRGQHSQGPTLPPMILQTRNYLDRHLDQTVTLGILAERAHCSESYLCESFTRWMGMPPIEYLIRLRMQAAMHHLCDRNKRIGEVARLVGYPDLYYFSRLFKKRTGRSPRAMRHELTGGA